MKTKVTKIRDWICPMLLVLAVSCLRPAAVYAGNSYQLLQNKMQSSINRFAESLVPQYNKTISLDLRQVPLSQALHQLAREAGIGISFNSDLVRDKLVTEHFKGVTVTQAVKDLLAGTGLVAMFSHHPDILFIREKQKKLAFIVQGKVTDSSTGEALPGVNIIVKGTTIGTATDENGNYDLSVPLPTDTLIFSFIGYESQTVPVHGRARIDVKLASRAVLGQQMVVVGYATQQVRDVSGSISTVTSDQLNPVATTSFNNMLEGKAAGLNLRQVSAQPGGASEVNIRGAISPNGNNTPLYVIDGVPITDYKSSVQGLNDATLGFYGGVNRDPLDYLNPSDIQSITVLKGAATAAIYGASAANGVILITTKKGHPGKFTVDYRGNFSIERSKKYFPLMNAKQFMQQQTRLSHDYYLYSNHLAPYGDADPGSVTPFTPFFSQSQINAAGSGTDWIGLLTRPGYINEHNISISGGSQHTTVYVSFNYHDNQAILKNSDLKKYSGRINLDQDLGNFAHLSLKMTASQINSDNASTGSNAGGPEKYNMIQAAMSYAPTIGVFDSTGQYMDSYYPIIMNPVAFLAIQDNSQTNHFLAAPDLTINFTNNLKGNVVGGLDLQQTNRSFYLPRITNNSQLPDGMAQKNNGQIDNYSLEGYLTYTDHFASSRLTVVAGAGYYKTMDEGFGLSGIGFFTDAFSYNNVGVSNDLLKNTISSYKDERTKLSQFLRINYTLRDRYILSLVGRRDGSSIFAANKKYGIFPGGSVAWRVSQESFMQPLKPVLSDLKLRAGYGMAGNESILVGNSLSLYNPGYPFLIGSTLYNGVAISQVANPDLTWEKDITLDVGADFALWTDRISGSVDVYQKTAKDLLDFNPLPINNAVGRVADNVGTTRSKGLEISLHTLNIQSRSFQWSSDINLSTYKAYWVKRNPRVPLPSYEGYHDPIHAIYGWKTDGLIKNNDDKPSYMPDALPGNIKYVDVNGDGKLDINDVVMLGNADPKWTFGFNNTLSYKNFDLTVYVYGNLGRSIDNNYAPNTAAIYPFDQPQNTTIYARDIWSVDNPNGTYPGVASNPYDSSNPTGNNDFNLEKVNFLRLRNITLGYDLPLSWFGSNSAISNFRVFVSLQDLGVITNYNGFDPEYTEANPYPKTYTSTFGVNVRF